MTLFISISTAIMIAGSAYAEPAWVKTPFWQTVYEKAQVVKIKEDTNLTDICEEYSSLVRTDTGRPGLSAREVDVLRKNTSDIHTPLFSATFTIDRAATDHLFSQSVQNLESEISAAAVHDVLPYYTAAPATIFPLDEISSPIQIAFTSDSLSRISQTLGLVPLNIEVASHVPEFKIRVYGLDSACDLFRGQAHLKTGSAGQVKIALDRQFQLSEFYQSFEELTEHAFNQTNKPFVRMAFLGYNLASLLAPMQLPREAATNLVEALVSDFFNSQGQRNENWTVFEGVPHLSVRGSISARFQLKMER